MSVQQQHSKLALWRNQAYHVSAKGHGGFDEQVVSGSQNAPSLDCAGSTGYTANIPCLHLLLPDLNNTFTD